MTVPEDLAALVSVSSLALSCDAGRLAVATRRADLARDAYEQHVVLFERNATAWSPRAAPHLEGSQPVFSPSGELLALIEPRGHGCRLVVHDLSLRTRHELLEWPDDVEELSWSPSGRLLGFVARQPLPPPGVVLASRADPPHVLRQLQYRMDSVGFTADRLRHCFALELDGALATGAGPGDDDDGEGGGGSSRGGEGGSSRGGGAPVAGAGSTGLRNLSGSGFDDYGLVWLGSDDSWAFVSRRHDGREWDVVADVFVGSAGGDAPRLEKLTATDRLWGPLAYDPAGRALYSRYQLVAEFPCDEKLARIDLRDGAVEPVELGVQRSLAGRLVVSGATLGAAAPAAAAPPAAAMPGGFPPGPDPGSSVFSLLADAGSVRLVRLGGEGHRRPSGEGPQRLSADGVLSAFDAAAGWAALAGCFSGQPAVVQVLELAGGGEPVTVFEPNRGLAQATGLVVADYVGATAEDGTHLDCWVLLPGEGSDLVGSALYIPGGGGQFGFDYVHDFQVLASAGIAVIFGNARGSGGYGESWMRTVCGPGSAFSGSGWGGVDRSDMLAMTAAVLDAHPQLPRDRVGVLGGSYGGLMAALLGFSSDRFCAVVAERGPFDLAQMAATSDEGAWFFDAYIGAGADTDPGQYAFSSVMSYLDGVKQPVLIVHAEEDLRCPVQQAEELFTALRRRDADVTFVRFPGESHELSRSGSPVHRLQRIQIICDWLVARLEGRMAAFELGL